VSPGLPSHQRLNFKLSACELTLAAPSGLGSGAPALQPRKTNANTPPAISTIRIATSSLALMASFK
jgi:hypothetical protein